MGFTKKGLKGFQKIDEEEQKSKRTLTYLTKSESKKLKDYCNDNNIHVSSLIRDLILKII
tara:strand:- start:260 stop:439 length:180 start_codon:yes stop_codon:yes gene_type:complete